MEEVLGGRAVLLASQRMARRLGIAAETGS